MRRYFTQYWKNDRWERHREEYDGEEFIHTAGNEFRSKGVKTGDNIYVITVIRGQLFLAGRIVVDRLVGQKEAERLLGPQIHKAEDHVLALENDAVAFDFNRAVRAKVTKRLQFVRAHQEPVPAMFKEGRLDRQTLRMVRELTAESAELLDGIIDTEG